MSNPKIDPKILARAIEAAQNLCIKVRSQYAKGSIVTFKDLEKYGIELPADWTEAGKTKPILKEQGHFYLFVEPLLKKFVASTEARLLRSMRSDGQGRRKLTLAPSESCRKLGRFTLFREQEPVAAAVIDHLYVNNNRAALIPAGTGAGKTQMMAAVIQHLLSSDAYKSFPFPLPYPVIILTVKNAVAQTKQRLIDCGFGAELEKQIINVWPYSALTSSFGFDRLLSEVIYTDPHSGQEEKAYNYKPFALPMLLVLDECHALAKETSQRHKAVKAMDLAARNCPMISFKALFLSATPAERVNDGRTFTCISQVSYQGVEISWDNFNTNFARLLAADPNDANKESVKRMFAAWGENVFEPPYIKWPYKQINACKLYGYRTPADRDWVNRAEADYLDRISSLGRDTPNELALRRIALLQLRKRVEPSRAELMVDDMVKEVFKGNTSLCGTAFRGTIIRGLFYLLDTYPQWTRRHVSVIWGGYGDPRPERILTPGDMLELLQQPELSAKDMRLLQKNLDWQEDRWLFADADADAQDERYKRLKSLGLIGPQSQDQRQEEIERFQSGESLFCFYTMASGGTGLSLEHCDERQRPRVGFYTPIYNAKEWVQALGRPHRRNSISDTRCYICLLEDSIEQSHVAPKLDKKLQSLGAGFSQSSKDDIFNALINLDAIELRQKVQAQLRTEEQCAKDAENEETQLHETDLKEDDDDE